MQLVEGVARVGGERFPDVEAFVDRLAAIATEHGATVQAFDARYVVGPEHVERAVELTDRARDRGEAVARERGVEILLYAAGRRQIDRAMEMGVEEGETPVVVLVDGHRGDGGNGGDGGDGEDGEDGGDGREGGDGGDRNVRAAASAVREILEPAETLGNYDEERVRAFFDVSRRELAATDASLADLVVERVALLEVEK